ncbi:TPA: hypothetical protein SAN82_004139 [Pseudomonas putida]|nr:hypothetical protein [Pseudomonas putida]
MRLTQLVVSSRPGNGKPANLWINLRAYIEGHAPLEWRSTRGGQLKGDWRVSHSALPGHWPWVTSAQLY